tara:strand:+ start:186 stop:464 length:279 start_codon:yes stop_codon:yes gene_type:complete
MKANEKYSRRKASCLQPGWVIRMDDYFLGELGYERVTAQRYPKVHGTILSVKDQTDRQVLTISVEGKIFSDYLANDANVNVVQWSITNMSKE